MGEKTATEKAIIDALQARDEWQRRKSLQHTLSKSTKPSTPTTHMGFTKMSDMYGGDSPKGIEESSYHSKYDKDRTNRQ